MEFILNKLWISISQFATVGMDWVDDDTEYPYVVYQYSENSSGEFESVGTLNLNIWDKSESLAGVIDVANNIIGDLESKIFIDPIHKIAYRIKVENFQNMKEPDKVIKRIDASFTVRKCGIM